MSDDAEPSHPEALRIEASYEGAEVTVTVAGSLDLNGSEQLRASVDEALSSRPEWIAIEAGAVTFVGSTGLQRCSGRVTW